MSTESIILASGSPRRRELLAEMGVRFEVKTVPTRELDAVSAPGMPPANLAMENARLKAAAVARSEKGSWVLGADTVVALSRRVHRASSFEGITLDESHRLETRLFGKPATLDEAREFLRALSGRTHEVITGCVLVDPDGCEKVFHELTQVTFRALTEEIIARYLAEVHVLDKAGAYALQERGEWIIERVEGSRSNVIGLPCEALKKVLAGYGLL